MCVKKYLYILPGETEKERQLIENFYSNNIEGDYNRVYKILTEDNKTSINFEERELIISTILSLLLRNPYTYYMLNNLWSDTIEKSYGMANSFKDSKINIGQKIIDPNKKPLEESIKNAKEENRLIFNRAHIKYFYKLMSIRINDGISVCTLQDDYEFVSSDNPVIVSNQATSLTGPANPSNFLRLPINSKKCLIIYPHGTKDINRESIYRRNLENELAELECIAISRSQYHQSHNLIFGNESSLALVNQYNSMTDVDFKRIENNAKLRMNNLIVDAMNKWYKNNE